MPADALNPADFASWEEFVEADRARQLRRRQEDTFGGAMGPGTCWGCGFAGYRRSGTGERIETLDGNMRQNGVLPEGYDLWCWQEQMHMPRALDEIEEHLQYWNNLLPKRSQAVRDLLQEPRPQCVEAKRWHPYRDGLDVFDHYQEWHAMQLEQQRRDWESAMEKERREFEERLDTSNKSFLAGLETERRNWERDTAKWPSRLIWAAAILALGQVIAAILALPLIARLLHLD